MAKKKEEQILDMEVLFAEDEEKKEEVSEVIIEKVETKHVEDNVKIRLRKPHRCFVGDKWYDFEAEKVYIVPKNVKEILIKNDLLLPL